MRDKILMTFALAELVFLLSGVLLVVFALVSKADINATPTLSNVSRHLVLSLGPGTVVLGNAGAVFFTFLLSIPAMLMPMSRGWLRLHGYMIVVCALFSLALGLFIWIETLTTRTRLGNIWNAIPASTQSLLQQEFECCGYDNSTSPLFVTDSQCPSALAAASQEGCVSPFSTFANNFLDMIFTGAFGIVGVDVVLIFATLMLSKDRAEKERYHYIDEKTGTRAI